MHRSPARHGAFLPRAWAIGPYVTLSAQRGVGPRPCGDRDAAAVAGRFGRFGEAPGFDEPPRLVVAVMGCCDAEMYALRILSARDRRDNDATAYTIHEFVFCPFCLADVITELADMMVAVLDRSWAGWRGAERRPARPDRDQPVRCP